LTDVANPDLITEHKDQHIESSETEKSPVKMSKILNSEYMRNKKMIESAERNVKYVIFLKMCYIEETFSYLLYLNNMQLSEGVLIRAVHTNLSRKKLCSNMFFAIQNLQGHSNAAYVEI